MTCQMTPAAAAHTLYPHQLPPNASAAADHCDCCQNRRGNNIRLSTRNCDGWPRNSRLTTGAVFVITLIGPRHILRTLYINVRRIINQLETQ
eukprot:scaffold429144_cov13-Prasinocladus_malaysianus.AAC.1